MWFRIYEPHDWLPNRPHHLLLYPTRCKGRIRPDVRGALATFLQLLLSGILDVNINRGKKCNLQRCDLQFFQHKYFFRISPTPLRSTSEISFYFKGERKMTSQIKPIRVWGQVGPNPLKIAIILKELDLLYEVVPVPLSDIKKPEYLAINPNGRLPAIHDLNTGIILWETGAIIEYLIEHYDTQHRLSFAAGTPESYHAKQWLFFQATGQGPYYGQLVWFKKFHIEQVPSAIERYINELNRVTGVLDGYLSLQKQEHDDSTDGDGPWLVGNKFSYADIAFIAHQRMPSMYFDKDEFDEDKFPHVKEWLGKMTSRETVKAVVESYDHAMGQTDFSTIQDRKMSEAR